MLFTLLVFALVTLVIYECIKSFRRYQQHRPIQFNRYVGAFGISLIIIGIIIR